MEQKDALRSLPEAYNVAITLRDQGVDLVMIAARLGVAPEAIGPLMRLAEAKLARLVNSDPTHEV